MSTKVRRETYSCTGRGFSMLDTHNNGYMSRFFSFMTRPNVHGATKLITVIDHTTNYFTVVGHGYTDGQSVALTGGTAPAELILTTSLAYPFLRTVIQEYFIIKVSDDIFQLALTHYNAMAGTAIDFTDNGSGDSTISVTALGGGAEWYLVDDFSRMAAKNFATTDVNVSSDVITLVAHGFANYHKVTFSSTTTVPGGLVAGTAYWLIRLTANTFKVAASEVNAFTATAINITSQGTGTHTITTAEHYVVLCDTAAPVVNDYNTSPCGVAPKFIKIGYLNSESGYVRMQGYFWWDAPTHTGRMCWSGYRTITLDSVDFVYQFIAGDEFVFQATYSSAAWSYQYIDTFTGLSSKLEAITKVGVLASTASAGSSVVVQLGTGEAANFTLNKYYYIYNCNGVDRVNYSKVTNVDLGADQVTLDTLSVDFAAGSVLTSYAHRYYSVGTAVDQINMCSQSTCYLPYVSCSTQSRVAHAQNYSIHQTVAQYVDNITSADNYLGTGIPDDEGFYDCMRLVLMDYGYPSYYDRSPSMNRIYGKSNNIIKTYRNTMGQMVNTRKLLGIDFLMITPSANYCLMVTYSESAV